MGESTPICRCRVLYLGSAVPRQSKDGLQGIQEPLRSLYPSEGAIGAKGIDSWLSVWSNGILLENVDENGKQVTRFFPIESLHYCAAVRQVLIPERGNTNPEPKFLPLDSPFARTPKSQHPPIFAAILRRTTGIKVLECHVFICKREAAANALVRCCFHAYADNSYAKQLESGSSTGTGGNMYGTLGRGRKSNDDLSNDWRLRNESTTTLSSVGKHSISHPLNGSTGANSAITNNGSLPGGGGYTFIKALYSSTTDLHAVDDDDGSICNGAENHKVWNGSHSQIDVIGRESPYEVFPGGVSTLERPAKARQISAPVPIPSPPFKEETKKKKNKKLSKHSGSQSLSGTLVRPKPIHVESLQRPSIHHMPPPPPPGNIMYSPVSQIPWQCHTFNHHRPVFSNGNMSGGRHHHVSTPQIAPPPMPAIIPAQYATLQSGRTSKKKKQDRLSSIPVGVPLPPPMFTYMPPPPSGSQSMLPTLILSNKKLAQSVGGGLDDSTNSGGESPGATGIYKRKGHLNERAFSYSIRQEHRSRSHGSLASLQFNSPDMKKEQEIAQMMSGLDLNDEPMLNQEKRYMASTSSYLPVETFGRVRR